MKIYTVRGKSVIAKKPRKWPSVKAITQRGMLLEICQNNLNWLDQAYLGPFFNNWKNLVNKEHTPIGGVLIMNDEGVEEIFIDVIHIQNQVWQLNYYEAENGKRDKSCKMSIIADFTAIPTECILAYVEKDSLGNIGECNEYMLKIVQFMTAVRAYMIMSHLTDGPMPESATDTSWRKATIEPVSINLFGKMVMI